MSNRNDQPFHCGPRMEFVPGFAMDRYTCKNCGAIAVRNREGFTVYQNQEHMDKVLRSRRLPPSPLVGYFDQRDLDWMKDESEGN